MVSGAIVGHKDGNYGSLYPRVDEFGSVGVPFLTAKLISGGKIDIEEAPRLANERADALTFGFVQANDVLLSHNATIGRVAIVPEFEGRLLIGTSLTYFRVNPEKLSPRYFAAYLAGADFQAQLGAVMSHSTRNQVPITAQRKLSIVVPPLSTQHAIAGILGALDDKIEQNLRIARALEQLAHAIFRAWFVDFEPVKAKAEGATSFPSMPQPVFDTLPTRFVDSEIGPVPEGWAVRAIGDVVMVKGGGTPSTKNPEYWDGGVHCWATPKDMSRLVHPVLLDTQRRITDSGIECISSGLLPVGTVLMSSRAPVGYLAIAGVPTAINQGFIAMVCDGPLPPLFILNWAATSMDTIKAHASGTTFPEISKSSFRPLRIIQPSADTVTAYHQTVNPLFNLLTASVRESERLAEIRDYLLPRLLSGSVRAPHD